MSDIIPGSHGDLGPYSKPINTFIERMADFMEPSRVRRLGAANAEAFIVQAKAEIEADGMRARAARDQEMESLRFLKNKISIIAEAAKKVPQGSSVAIEDDWLSTFFDKAKHVSRPEAQEIWSRLLAGEAANPGGYSKRTINILSELELKDAVLFENLCKYVWTIGSPSPVIIECQADIYSINNINFATLSHLSEIGLVKFTSIETLERTSMVASPSISYGAFSVSPVFKSGPPFKIPIGQVKFTQSGEELYTLCNKSFVPGFVDYVRLKWGSALTF
jgi:hypothetical protein